MLDLTKAVVRGRDALDAADGKFDHYDRSKYGNASEIGGCIRKQWYERNVKTPQEQDWGFARRGTHAEKYVIESLRAANVVLDGVGEDQFSIQDDDLLLSATPDGVFSEDGEWFGLEIKSIDPRTNTSRLPKPDHVTQLDVAMGLLNKHRGFDIKRGVVLYIDASNFNLLHQFEVKHDKRVLDQMSRRAKRMLRARSAEPLDREGQKTNQCRYCAFKTQCGVTVSEAADRQGPTRSNRGSRLHAAVTSYGEAKEQADAAKAVMDEAKTEIIEGLQKRGVSELPVGEFVASLKNVAGRTTYDTKKAIADGVDLSPYQKTGAPSVRLDVKRSTAA
jgi:CRISPR/Cas system-associated exonuclease Cas4 (RecB family)